MPEKGFFELYASARPILPAGSYVLAADHELRATPPNNASGDLAVDGTDFTLKIISPRYTIPPNQILSTFPPAAAVGDWRQRLPQIVFKRRTLPWERDPTPWTCGSATTPRRLRTWRWWCWPKARRPQRRHRSPRVTPGTPMLDDADTSTGKYLEVRRRSSTRFSDGRRPAAAGSRSQGQPRRHRTRPGDDDGYLRWCVEPPAPARPGRTAIPTTPVTSGVAHGVPHQRRGPAAQPAHTEQSDPEFHWVSITLPSSRPSPNQSIDVVTMKVGTALRCCRNAPPTPSAPSPSNGRPQRHRDAASGFASGPAKTVAVAPTTTPRRPGGSGRRCPRLPRSAALRARSHLSLPVLTSTSCAPTTAPSRS